MFIFIPPHIEDLPEWLWIILIGVIVVGLVKALWSQRNQNFVTKEFLKNLTEEQGFLSTLKHTEVCDKVQREFVMDTEKISASMNEGLRVHSQNIQMLLNAKFESLDEKIENKVLKELRSLSNGNGRIKPKIIRKKK